MGRGEVYKGRLGPSTSGGKRITSKVCNHLK